MRFPPSRSSGQLSILARVLPQRSNTSNRLTGIVVDHKEAGMHIQDGEVIEEWDESEPISHLRGNKFMAILAWFLLCAALMWPVNQLHMGFVGLVIAMATAILILLWARWLFRVIQRKMAGISLTRRQWAEMAMGVEPGAIVDEAEPDSTFAPGGGAQKSLSPRPCSPSTALPPYSHPRVSPPQRE